MILQTKWCWYWPPSSGSIPKCFNPGTKIPHQMMMEGTQLTAKSFWSIFGQPGQTWLLFSEMYHTRWTNSAFVRRSLVMPTLWPAFAWTTTMLRSCFTISIVSMEWFNCDRSMFAIMFWYTLWIPMFLLYSPIFSRASIFGLHICWKCVYASGGGSGDAGNWGYNVQQQQLAIYKCTSPPFCANGTSTIHSKSEKVCGTTFSVKKICGKSA